MKFYECSDCGSKLIPESITCPHCGKPAQYPDEADLRCECGFLLCKITPEYLEIKCRRCKRIVVLPILELPERYQNNVRRSRDRRPGPYVSRIGSGPAARGQLCSSCGRLKPNVVYGKCLDCRTETIKVQYRGRTR
jgi:phage FluMu protein Com